MKRFISLLSVFALLFVQLTVLPAFAAGDANIGYNYALDRVTTYMYIGHDSALSQAHYNETTDASDSDTGDVYMPKHVDDALYLGLEYMFDGMTVAVSDPSSSDGKYVFEYWDGDSWESLTLTETPSDYTVELGYNYFYWERPADWTAAALADIADDTDSEDYYYARMRLTQEYSDEMSASKVGAISFTLKVVATDENGEAMTGLTEDEFLVGVNLETRDVDGTVYNFKEIEDGVYGFAMVARVGTDPELAVGVYPAGYEGEDAYCEGLNLEPEDQIECTGEAFYYAHKAVAINDAGADVELLEAVVDEGGDDFACYVEENQAFCDVSIDDDHYNKEMTVRATGYVQEDVMLDERISKTEAQEVYEMLLDYAYLINVAGDDGATIEAAAVTLKAGDTTTCDDLGGGQYGCAAGLADGAVTLNAVADGYDDLEVKLAEYRDGHSDGQIAETVTMELADSSDDEEEEPEEDDEEEVVDDEEAAEDEEVDDETDTDGDGVYDWIEEAMGTDSDDAEDYLANWPDYELDCEDEFEDTHGHWAEQSICLLNEAGVVSGRSDEEFAPSEYITRAEFLKVMLLNAGYEVEAVSTVSYDDVSEEDWFYEYVTYATDQGFVEGYDDGTFAPDGNINRAEAMVMMMRILGQELSDFTESDIMFSDIDVSHWFAYAVILGSQDKIVEGYEDDTFRPEDDISRAEVAVIARRAYYVYVWVDA